MRPYSLVLKSRSILLTNTIIDFGIVVHLSLLLLGRPFPLVGLRLPDAETRSVVLGAALLHRLTQGVLRRRRRKGQEPQSNGRQRKMEGRRGTRKN